MSELLALAEERFPDLSEVERRLVTGIAAELRVDLSDGDASRQDPSKTVEWEAQQLVRAMVLRWLLTNAKSMETTPVTGIDLHYALVDGDFSLMHTKIERPLRFIHCRFGTVRMYYSEVAFLSLAGSVVDKLDATGGRVATDLLLNNKFKSNGSVLLQGMEIGQDLNCNNAEITPKQGMALVASFCRVHGSVNLGDGFKATGPVNLMRSRIDGDVDCSGGEFSSGIKDASGDVKEALDYALALDGAKIGGGLLLREGFAANGEVRLLSAEIKGQLSCRGGTFRELAKGHAFTADGAQLAGTLWLGAAVEGKQKTNFHGSVQLQSCDVLEVACNPEAFGDGARGNLDGLRYKRLHFLNAKNVSRAPDSKLCERWLTFATQSGFARQPFSQLASVLRASGDDELADEVMLHMHRIRHRQLTGFWNRTKSWLFDLVLGYGYRPRYCLGLLGGLLLAGTLIFALARDAGVLVERPQLVVTQGGNAALASEGRKPATFNAFIFSLESLVPVADLGQKKRWELSEREESHGKLAVYYFYLHSILGPLLSALFSVGLTGLVRKG